MRKSLALLAALLLFASPCWSEESAPAPDITPINTSKTATITAVVEAINHETREVTLGGPEGDVISFVVRQDAGNLDQVSVGDLVVAQYEQSILVEVIAGDGSAPSESFMSVAGRSEKGAIPGATIMDTVVITATVTEINIQANTFKLKGPNDEIQEYIARNPENLTKASVGDIVVTTITESIALSVEKAAVE